jgi:hypothetical protein
MWSSPETGIPTAQIVAEHIRVLESALASACEEDFDPRNPALQETLEYLERKTIRTGGFRLFRSGLDRGNLADMKAGLALIKKHMGLLDR